VPTRDAVKQQLCLHVLYVLWTDAYRRTCGSTTFPASWTWTPP
jgi:hypothetical protein